MIFGINSPGSANTMWMHFSSLPERKFLKRGVEGTYKSAGCMTVWKFVLENTRIVPRYGD